RTASLLSEFQTFVDLDTRLETWKRNLLMPEDLRDDATEAKDISYFGTADHRRFMMRVRYFCLHCYYVPITIFLHQSNRPSFFTEYEQPLEVRLRQRRQKQKEQQPDHEQADDSDVRESEIALREMLNMAFASSWNEGLLAYDIEDRSWGVCVRAAHGLSEHLERNVDFPLERFDQIIPFCIFMSVSVLIRQVRICNRLMAAGSGARTPAQAALFRRLSNLGGVQTVATERAMCIKHIRHQWDTLQRLSSVWDVQGMQHLLKSMQVDEIANAADLLSGMSL
ncbi:hypothetical protein IW150_006418, partial [Coemansia sp. RSA 2607]